MQTLIAWFVTFSSLLTGIAIGLHIGKPFEIRDITRKVTKKLKRKAKKVDVGPVEQLSDFEKDRIGTPEWEAEKEVEKTLDSHESFKVPQVPEE